MPSFTDTIAALATPTGTSAIAVVRISGPDTSALSAALFGATPPPRSVMRGDYRSISGELLDDVLYVFFQGPASYTGEDSLEISCHGNPFIAQKILSDCLARGCRSAEPGEFTQRAFLSGKIDLSQAEAVMDLIHARSERALAAANQQLRGSLGRKMSGLIDGLLQVLARIEAYIDFPEEDLPVEDRAVVIKEVQRLAMETDLLLATSRYGELLRDGIKLVILGEPNVGKSSILNRLVGHDRALVSPEPGTTRDFIEERIVLGPHLIRVVDTAGLNPSPASLEKLGMEKTIQRAAEADLFLLVVEPVGQVPILPPEVQARMTPSNCLILFNKSDLGIRQAQFELPRQLTVLSISALTGDGFIELASAVTALADKMTTPMGGDFIAVNARHAQALTSARTGLRDADESLTKGDPIELSASELRGVLASYGEIAGKVDNERMLDALFATFCIGK
jgi:tRNA modification GTPase